MASPVLAPQRPGAGCDRPVRRIEITPVLLGVQPQSPAISVETQMI
jgi:hypothetical protein